MRSRACVIVLEGKTSFFFSRLFREEIYRAIEF